MYRNVVSTRELLSDSFSSERQDSHDFSCDRQQYSQLAYSQPEFSQISSQDMFTQQLSNGSQIETINNVPNRKPTLYDKWKNKTTTPFRQLPVEKGSVSSLASRPPPSHPKPDLSLQHQLQINKAKAKERDERDFLQQVVNTVQDCSKEVKLTLTSVRDKLEHDGEKSEQNLQHTITSFLDDLCKHQERILIAVQEKDSNSTKCHELEKDLALKDAKIHYLEKIIEEHKRDAPERIIRALQKQLHSPQQKFDEKLCELLETTRDNHEQYIQQIQEQRQQLEQQQTLYSELKKSQQTQVKESEKRLINEVSNLRKDIRKKETTCLQDILEQLKSAQEQQFEELEKQITGLLDESNHMASDNPRDQRLQKKEVQDLLKKHWEGVEKIVEAQFRKHLKLQERQLGEVVDRLSEKESRDDLQCDSFLSLPQFEDKMGRYHEDFKKQVEFLHDRHVQELKQLRSEMAAKQKETATFPVGTQTQAAMIIGERLSWDQECMKSDKFNDNEKRSVASSHVKEFPKSSSTFEGNSMNGSRERRESAIVSPLTANYKKLNTRSFFSKTAFSPVATVLPQKKETQEVQISNLAQENHPLPDETVPNTVPNNTKKKTKRRKKRSKFAKPKKTKPAAPKLPSQINVEEKPLSQNLPVEKAASKLPTAENPLSNTVVPTYPRSNTMLPRESKSKTAVSTNLMCKKVPESGINSSVYDFRDEDIPVTHPNKNRSIFGSRTQSYSYNLKNKELMTVNTSQTVSFPRPSESPCTNSMSRDSSPSLSITEVFVKRRIKCNKRTPDINLHFNPSRFDKLGTDSRFPVYDILSTPTVNAVDSQQNKTFWTYKQTMKEAQTVRRAGEKRRLCDINISNNVMQCLRNQPKRICQ